MHAGIALIGLTVAAAPVVLLVAAALDWRDKRERAKRAEERTRWLRENVSLLPTDGWMKVTASFTIRCEKGDSVWSDGVDEGENLPMHFNGRYDSFWEVEEWIKKQRLPLSFAGCGRIESGQGEVSRHTRQWIRKPVRMVQAHVWVRKSATERFLREFPILAPGVHRVRDPYHCEEIPGPPSSCAPILGSGTMCCNGAQGAMHVVWNVPDQLLKGDTHHVS